MIATIRLPSIEGVNGELVRWPRRTKPRTRNAAAGASQPALNAVGASTSEIRPGNRRFSRLADGGRGAHECNCFSNSFSSFIINSFQAGLKLFQAITISSRSSIWRNLEEFAYFFECVVMPYLEHNHLSLKLRELGKGLHGAGFLGLLVRRSFEPAAGFQFPSQAPPQAAAIIEGAIAEAANAIMLGLLGSIRFLAKRQKSLLKNVLGFAMRQAQSPAIEHQFRRFAPVNRLTPAGYVARIHPISTYRHSEPRICIRKSAEPDLTERTSGLLLMDLQGNSAELPPLHNGGEGISATSLS